MRKQTIGYDKLNMLRHAEAFKDKYSVIEHMKKIADKLRPNFDITLEVLQMELSKLEIAKWTHPHGGYFISFNSTIGSAKRIDKRNFPRC